MLEIQNSKERDAKGWEYLFETADAGFKFLLVRQPPESKLAVIKSVWEGHLNT